MMRLLIALLGVLLSQTLCAQVKQTQVLLEWNDTVLTTKNGTSQLYLRLKNVDLSGYKPVFAWKSKLAKNQSAILTVIVTDREMLTSEQKNAAINQGIQFEQQLNVRQNCVNSRDERFVSMEFEPFLLENGTYYRVKQIQIVSELSPYVRKTDKDFVSESVLNDISSEWYKLSVSKDGLYKLDYDFLYSCGVNVAALNPNHLNVYGNGDGKLPEANSKYKTDDLAKNAISFVGDTDAEFEQGEYFVFYGWGPHNWVNSGGVFRRDINIYSDVSYYFIRISSSELPLRVATLSTSGLVPTQTVSSYNYMDVFEEEKVNLVGGGQRWYGDEYDLELTKTYSFSVPNKVSTEPYRFISSIASNTNSGGSTLQVKAGNKLLISTSLPTAGTDYGRKEFEFNDTTTASSVSLVYTVNRLNASIITYLDKIELNTRRVLYYNGQLRFRDVESVGTGTVSQFQLLNVASSHFIWDVTDKHLPKRVELNVTGTTADFVVQTDSLREFAWSNANDFFTPTFVKTVSPQNLHGLGYADLLIVTHPSFITQANRLAQIHLNEDGTTSHVVTLEQVYNEFSGGTPDPTAIRWFCKMFYDRANGNASLMPENLLLFGDGTYDPKNRLAGNNYFVPTYQTLISEDHINALVTDDYFGMLDNNESISSNDMMDIGVGRMIVSSAEQADQMVDKIEQYLRKGMNTSDVGSCSGSTQACSSFGDWRLKLINISDDEEGGYFVNVDNEPVYTQVKASNPEVNIDKIYIDAYQQVSGAGGDRYPSVVEAINDRIERGALIVNYVGHGGEEQAAEEQIITIPQIRDWSNFCHLNLFLSATCEFTRFDDPSRTSTGEWMYLDADGGAIAMATTTRSVFFNVNSDIIKKFFLNVYQRESDFKPKTFGEIMRLTKNQASSGTNKRSFNLIGDPALRIALPYYKVVTDSINSFSPISYTDTLQALSKVTIKGHVEDFSGNTLSSFNGILQPTVFDKPKTFETLGQDADSPQIDFELQKNSLYKGKVTVSNGQFTFSFIVPKDIRYEFGLGKLSYYANTETIDAGGSEQRFIVGGISAEGLNDQTGPEIELYFNSDKFVDGGLTDEQPVLIAKLFDENGINAVGNGIGHDLMAILDAETANPIVLNDYYNADLDTYQSGEVRYPFQNLAVGRHTLTLKAWDVNNNSSEETIEFVVQEKGVFQLEHVLNYPNPFTTSTHFFFEHNQLCDNLDVLIQVFTVSGKLVKTISQEVYNECYRSDGIQWDGKDDFGDQLAKGVYIYRLKVRSSAGDIAEKTEKLVILK